MKDRIFQAGAKATIIEVLNFALILDYMQQEFYMNALLVPDLIPNGDRVIFTQIGRHETAHVALLLSILGSDATVKPIPDFTAGGLFQDVFANYATFLTVSQCFEDTSVRAYKGQATALMSNKAVLTTALQIHSVEARHAAQVRRLRGQKGWITSSTTDVSALAAIYAGEGNSLHGGVDVGASAAASEAFDEPLAMAEVLAILGPFITN